MSMGSAKEQLRQRLEARRATTAVIGMGYVGLPLAVEFARGGYRAVGFDVNSRKVEAVCAGRSYIPDVPEDDVRTFVQAGHLTATTDFARLAEADTINICVPTPLRKTKDPDISYIVAATEHIAKTLRSGQLVVLESTTYPGTTEEVILPMLTHGGLSAGKDFFLAFSPERVDPGNPRWNTRNMPKVVGGHTPDCTELACLLYGACIEQVVPVSSTRIAEMVKLLENTFRSVNIGLVNELALMCNTMGIDVWEVIQAAATKPFGFMPFYPGPGLGGHCIPIDPFYLSWKARQSGFEARFIELAGHVNGQMPAYVVQRVMEALNSRRKAVNGSRILVLGVAYKANIDDVRESPALDVITLLRKYGAEVSYADPYIPDLEAEGISLSAVPLAAERVRQSDCAVIITNHRDFDYDLLVEHAPLIVDTRNALAGRGKPGQVFKI